MKTGENAVQMHNPLISEMRSKRNSMEEFKDFEETKKETNFKKWSFKLLVYVIIINLVIAYLVARFMPLIHNVETFNLRLLILGIVANVLWLIGLVLMILSVVKKETKNYQYYFSVLGYPLYIIFTMSSTLL